MSQAAKHFVESHVCYHPNHPVFTGALAPPFRLRWTAGPPPVSGKSLTDAPSHQKPQTEGRKGHGRQEEARQIVPARQTHPGALNKKSLDITGRFFRKWELQYYGMFGGLVNVFKRQQTVLANKLLPQFKHVETIAASNMTNITWLFQTWLFSVVEQGAAWCCWGQKWRTAWTNWWRQRCPAMWPEKRAKGLAVEVDEFVDTNTFWSLTPSRTNSLDKI